MTQIKCPKCRTTDFANCHSIFCPMRKTKKQRKPGGGRKLKYGEPVKLKTFKCPISKEDHFQNEVNKILKSYVKELKNAKKP